MARDLLVFLEDLCLAGFPQTREKAIKLQDHLVKDLLTDLCSLGINLSASCMRDQSKKAEDLCPPVIFTPSTERVPETSSTSNLQDALKALGLPQEEAMP